MKIIGLDLRVHFYWCYVCPCSAPDAAKPLTVYHREKLQEKPRVLSPLLPILFKNPGKTKVLKTDLTEIQHLKPALPMFPILAVREGCLLLLTREALPFWKQLLPDTGSTRRLSASSDAGSTSFLETTSLETTSLEATSVETTSLEATSVENSSAGNSSAPYTLKYIDAWKEWHTMEVDPSVNACIYDPELFIEEDGSMKYQDDRYEVLHGVDVSEHQGYIDWEAVARAGYSFAFIRVGYRGYGEAGNLNEDAAAVDNLRRAKAAGLRVGTYIFSQALNEEEARAEADLAVGVITSSGVETDLPLMYDPELIKDDWGRANDITRGQVSLNTAAFRDQVEKTSALTVDIYSNLPWEHHYFDTDTMNQYEIWYADYEKGGSIRTKAMSPVLTERST